MDNYLTIHVRNVPKIFFAKVGPKCEFIAETDV